MSRTAFLVGGNKGKRDKQEQRKTKILPDARPEQVVSEVVVTATLNRENLVSAIEMRIKIIKQLGQSGLQAFNPLFGKNKFKSCKQKRKNSTIASATPRELQNTY